MKLLTLSQEGLPLLDGEPIDGLMGFRLSHDSVDEVPILEARIAVRLDAKTFLDDFGNDR